MMVWSLFIIDLMGLFFYNKNGSIISIGDLPTTNIIEPKNHFPASRLFILLLEQASCIHILDELLDFRFFTRLNSNGINVFDC